MRKEATGQLHYLIIYEKLKHQRRKEKNKYFEKFRVRREQELLNRLHGRDYELRLDKDVYWAVRVGHTRKRVLIWGV